MRLLSLLILTLAVSAPIMAAQSGYQRITNPENMPMLGVMMTPVPLSVQAQQQLPPDQGVYVQSVFNNSAAQSMGLQPGDVITQINGAPIGSMTDLRNEVLLNQVGDPVQVTVRRGGQEQSTTGQLGSWPENVPYYPIDPAWENRIKNWQERRIARMQDDVKQMRQAVADMAKDLEAASQQADNILGIRAAPMRGPDGNPLAWRFQYNIAPAPMEAVAPLAVQPDPDNENNAVSKEGMRTWHFDWRLISDHPKQESF